MAGEIKTGLGLDNSAFVKGIDGSLEAVRRLRAEMQRGTASQVASEERAQSRTRRAQEDTHRSERRNVVEKERMYKQYEGIINRVSDTVATKFASAFHKLNQEQENTVETVEEYLHAMSALSNAFSALNKGAEVVDFIAKAFEKAQANASGAAQEAKSYFAALREEAALKGDPGVTSGILSSNMLMSLQTGLSQGEASAFVQLFESSLPAGMQKGNITREVADQFGAAVAEMVARQGADPAVRGDLAGLISTYHKIGSAGEGLAIMEAIRQGLTEGRGSDKQLTEGLLKVAGQFVNDEGTAMIGSLPELAATIGVTSLTGGPAQAATRVEQMVRVIKGSNDQQMAFLAQLGVTPHMNMMERLEALVPKLNQIEDAAKRGVSLDEQLDLIGFDKSVMRGQRQELMSRSGNLYELMVNSGFGAEGLRALFEILGAFETLQERIEKARQPIQGETIAEMNRNFLASDLGQLLRAEQALVSSERITGITEMDADAAITIARAQATLAGEQKNAIVQMMDFFRPIWHGIPIPDADRGERLRIEGRAVQNLREQLKQEGILEDFERQQFGVTGGAFDIGGELAAQFFSGTYREQINAMLEFMREQAIEPLEGEFQKMEGLVTALDSSVEVTGELAATMKQLGVDIQELRGAIDRTYTNDRPIAPPQAPPGQRGR